LPVPVTLNRFFAPLPLFIFGICLHSCILCGAEQHHHVPTVEERRRLDRADLLDLFGETKQQVTSALRVQILAPPEHDRDLDLRALVEEAHDVALLGLVVLRRDLRPELDLLDLNLGLVLARELGLLLLLVSVLPVVHDPGDRRTGLRRHFHQIEVLSVGVVERIGRGLDPHLRAVFVDQPHLRHTNSLVHPRLGFGCGLRTDEPPRPQRLVTKLFLSSL